MRRFESAFAASPLRRGILRLGETRLVYRAEARRSRAKDGGPEQRQLEPDADAPLDTRDVAGFLQKPFTPANLVTVIQDAVRRRPQERG